MLRKFILLAAITAAPLMLAKASYARDWEKLGERHVGFISDHDTIEVGRREGKFKRIRLHVKDNDIELDNVKVVFASGEIEDLPFHEPIRAGRDSPAIDLRTAWRNGRYIREIRLHYHSRPSFRGEAVVEVWAQED